MKKESWSDIIGDSRPVLVDFYADWCGPCKAFAPIIQEVKDDINEEARVIKVNIDKNQKLASALKVKSIPTVIIYQEGKEVFRQAGMQTKQFLLDKLKELGA